MLKRLWQFLVEERSLVSVAPTSDLLQKTVDLQREQIKYLEAMLAREREINDKMIEKRAVAEPMDPNGKDRIPGRSSLRARREELQRLSREAREKLENPRKESA